MTSSGTGAARSGERTMPACRFYSSGNCKNGESCKFPHIRTDTDSTKEICRFFSLRGWCKHGENCRHRHVRDGTTAAAAISGAEICRNFAENGTCRFKGKCHYRHVRSEEPSVPEAAGCAGTAAATQVEPALRHATDSEPAATATTTAPDQTAEQTTTQDHSGYYSIPEVMPAPDWADWTDDEESPETLRLIWEIRNGRGSTSTRPSRGDEIVVEGMDPFLPGNELDRNLRDLGAHPDDD